MTEHTKKDADIWRNDLSRSISLYSYRGFVERLDQAPSSATSKTWFLIAKHLIARKCSAGIRVLCLRAWLGHTSRPQIENDWVERLLCLAMANRLNNLVPTLLELGWCPPANGIPSAQIQVRVSSELLAGRWSNPDLLFPGITHDPRYHFTLITGLLTPLSLSSGSFAAKLTKLPADIDLTVSLSKHFAGLSENELLGGVKPELRWPRMITTLARAGWLDIEVLRQEAQAKGAGPTLHRYINIAESLVLDRNTASPSPGSTRSALRL